MSRALRSLFTVTSMVNDQKYHWNSQPTLGLQCGMVHSRRGYVCMALDQQLKISSDNRQATEKR